MPNIFNCRKLYNTKGEQIGNYFTIYFHLLLSHSEKTEFFGGMLIGKENFQTHSMRPPRPATKARQRYHKKKKERKKERKKTIGQYY